MSVHLLCLTASGGLPLFSRKKGDWNNLPYSTIGSLNGVHMYCKQHGVNLKVTFMDGVIVVWKEYKSCLIFIVAAKGLTERVLENIIDIAFNALIFKISENEIINHKNIEQLKRDLKTNYLTIIDQLLTSVLSYDLIEFTNCLIGNEASKILCKLNEFSDRLGSPFCSIFARNKVIGGTEGWWDLNIIDRQLLILLLSSSSSMQRDVPVYLPMKSPNIAYRFVSIPLSHNVCLCTLCGVEPGYATIDMLTQQVWCSDIELLLNAEGCYPRNFPSDIQLDSGILGLILINSNNKRYVMSRNLQPTVHSKLSISSAGHRLDILKEFYYETVDTSYSSQLSSILEIYWSSDYYKCHSLTIGEHIICALYVPTIPIHTMRLLTERTLNSIICNKEIVW